MNFVLIDVLVVCNVFFHRPRNAETLKSVGVNPSLHWNWLFHIFERIGIVSLNCPRHMVCIAIVYIDVYFLDFSDPLLYMCIYKGLLLLQKNCVNLSPLVTFIVQEWKTTKRLSMSMSLYLSSSLQFVL